MGPPDFQNELFHQVVLRIEHGHFGYCSYYLVIYIVNYHDVNTSQLKSLKLKLSV